MGLHISMVIIVLQFSSCLEEIPSSKKSFIIQNLWRNLNSYMSVQAKYLYVDSYD